MIAEESKPNLLDAVEAASTQWKTAFNSGDAMGCASQYEKNAVMQARPFGTFTGREEIQSFWQKLIDDGFSNVNYINPQIEVIDENRAILRANWRMNKSSGIIHKELWVLQADGTAKLREDDFEANS